MTTDAASPKAGQYFASIAQQVQDAVELATQARKKGLDPEKKVDIPIAKNMAERVEGLISTVAPQLVGKGLINRINELEAQYGILSWQVALIIAEEVAREKFCAFADKREAMEVGIRVGFTYHTLGIVAAPLEGFVELKIKKRKDGKEYFAASYAGPIRGAGGTGAAFSAVIVDYIRKKMGYEPYDPTEEEVNRIVTEIQDYHERVTNLQYFPSEQELRFLVRHLPIEITGDPTEELEVSNYKDVPRIETNRIRGGVCLVLAEGIAQKAKKLWVRMEKWMESFGVEWTFLKEFLELQKSMKSKSAVAETKGKISPNYTYIADLVAGRPVLTHPLRYGGFRLRYGRTRCSGFSAAAIHPATQIILKKYLAIGTQLKVERPGKAASLTICDMVDGPIVKLASGTVVKLQTAAEAKRIVGEVREIIFLGDILFSYGDFFVNGHSLVPCGYVEEWYVHELTQALQKKYGGDIQKLGAATHVPYEHIQQFIDNPFTNPLDAISAHTLAQDLAIPMHPSHLQYWTALQAKDVLQIIRWLHEAKPQYDDGHKLEKIILPLRVTDKFLIEQIGLPHVVSSNEFVVIEHDHAISFLAALGLLKEFNPSACLATGEQALQQNPSITALELLQKISGLVMRDKGGTFIGARMGRPEKAKMRRLTGSPHVLFPVGEEGGKMRSFQEAVSRGKVTADFALFRCNTCNKENLYGACTTCGNPAPRLYLCEKCGPLPAKPCPRHGPIKAWVRKEIPIQQHLLQAAKLLGMSTIPDLIKGVRGTSNKEHIPEHLAKGILRAKYDIYVNKDGTTRYDMTELPLTHFRPKEIGTSVEKLRQLGYTEDTKGAPLTDQDQVLELKPQDVVLSSGLEALDETADKVLLRIGQFIDELLVKLYGLKPFYNFKSKEDIIGHLIIGLAPHISAGLIGRVIGFSETQGFFAHPLYHAGLRRDCDGDEACAMLLMDAFLNFSRQYLPDNRGGRTMDSPLVLTLRLIPSEVDDMAHGLDVAWSYPLELYEAALQYKNPWDVPIDQIKNRLGTEKQYEEMGYTHEITDLNAGVQCSAYKTLPSMEEKLKGQMETAEMIRAVDTRDVATLVIEKHFLKDTKGNLRKFSTQSFRCVNCNEIFRRPPLVGKCTKCRGKVIFTVSEGSVIKYLAPSVSLARKYGVSPYLMQTLELTQRRIEGVFGKAKDKQAGLGAWFG